MPSLDGGDMDDSGILELDTFLGVGWSAVGVLPFEDPLNVDKDGGGLVSAELIKGCGRFS